MFTGRALACISSTLVVSMVFLTVAPQTARADDPAADAGALLVKPGKLDGTILDLDGKTPVSGVKVTLTDSAGKVVSDIQTDEKGVFELGDQPAGKYSLKVGQATGKLVVKEGAKATSMRFVVDGPVALGKKSPAGAQKIDAISDTGLVIICVIVAVVALAIGVGVGYAIWSPQKKRIPFAVSQVNP